MMRPAGKDCWLVLVYGLAALFVLVLILALFGVGEIVLCVTVVCLTCVLGFGVFVFSRRDADEPPVLKIRKPPDWHD